MNIAHRVSAQIIFQYDRSSILIPPLHALQDAFRDNFLIQCHPESLLDMEVSSHHPRVFLIDFETAIAFPPELTMDECVVTGYPIGGSVSRPEVYSRPLAPEFASGKAYSPFKLDVWQLGNSFSNFKVGGDYYFLFIFWLPPAHHVSYFPEHSAKNRRCFGGHDRR